MYGSSLRIETRRPRALSSRPMLAAVMPLPSEEVTPPVTKTYFAMGSGPPGFFQCYRKRPLGGKAEQRDARPVAGRLEGPGRSLLPQREAPRGSSADRAR